MGSFLQVCCLSDLPIKSGDRVRFFLLTASPYHHPSVVNTDDLYTPRTWPFRGVYNEYGTITHYSETTLAYRSCMVGTAFDLVLSGPGPSIVSTFDGIVDRILRQEAEVRQRLPLDHPRVDETVPLFYGLILESVWQRAVKIRPIRDDLQDQIRTAWDLPVSERRAALLAHVRVAFPHRPSLRGLAEHLWIARDLDAPKEQVEHFLADALEFAAILDLAHDLGRFWRPSFPCHGQDENYSLHADWAYAISREANDLRRVAIIREREMERWRDCQPK